MHNFIQVIRNLNQKYIANNTIQWLILCSTLKSLQKLKTKINSNSLTSVRSGVAATRLSLEYRSRLPPDTQAKEPSAVICIDTGFNTIIGGHGHLLTKLKNNQVLCGFTGAATEPVNSSSDIFSAAPYKEVSFKDTFSIQ